MIGVRTAELPITPDRLLKLIERKCKSEDVSDPLELILPATRAFRTSSGFSESGSCKVTSNDDITKIEPYHNGALFGLDPAIPPDEVDEKWAVNVIPSEEYLAEPRE